MGKCFLGFFSLHYRQWLVGKIGSKAEQMSVLSGVDLRSVLLLNTSGHAK